jgi:hypothetical protein
MLSNEKCTHGWLMIIYRVPSTPSTSRVMVWKRVKELGAYLLQQSVYILPNLPKVREAVNQLKEQIHHLGGEGKVIEVASLGEEQEKQVIAGFNSNREEEYAEVVKACNELLLEIEQESKTEDFHFADLEENEKHIQRVSELFESVKSRDYFASPLQVKSGELMKECQQKFEEFSNEVYSREATAGEDKKFLFEPGGKYKEWRALAKKELVTKIQEIADNLNNNVLEVDGKKVGELPDSLVLEMGFKESRNEKSLELKIGWTSLKAAKKSKSH